METNNNFNDMEQAYPVLADYFAEKTVAMTGGTGFLGQALIEKLLRCCPRVKKIILLIRKKKDVSPSERLKDLAKSTAFDVLRELQPNFEEKLSFIPCQLDAKNLGLDKRSKKILLKETNIFIHSAATLNFKEHLRLAYDMNTKCVRKLMRLANQMISLQSFVHISTAYSNSDQRNITEEFRDPGVHYGDLESSLKWMDDATCTKVTPDLLKERPNTYTLTKALAEDVIKQESGNIPICIVRPSMIIPALQEPHPGWTSNMYGPTAFIITYQKGIIRSVIANKTVIADVTPVDFVVNGVLAAAMKTGCDFIRPRKATFSIRSDSSSRDSDLGTDSEGSASEFGSSFEDESNDGFVSKSSSTCSCTESNDETFDRIPKFQFSKNDQREIQVYHINTGTANPLNIGLLEKYVKKWSKQYPASPLRRPLTFLTENRTTHRLTTFLAQTIPCYVGDAVRVLLNKRRRFVRMNNAVISGMDVFEFFFTNSFTFGNENVERLRECLHEKDRKTFNFDPRAIEWNSYFEIYITGIRKYLLKEDISDYAVQRRRLRRLTFFDNCINGAIVLGGCGLLVASGVTKNMWPRVSSFSVKFPSF